MHMDDGIMEKAKLLVHSTSVKAQCKERAQSATHKTQVHHS